MSDLSVSEISDATIEADLARWTAATGEANGSLHLNLDLSGPPEIVASAMFANALLSGPFSDRTLVVRPPADPEPVAALIRSGVASALGGRSADTRFDPASSLLGRSKWSTTWTPGAISAVAPMFSETGPEPDLFGPHHAVFFNSHLTTPPGGPSSVTQLIRRWLTQRILNDGDSELGERRRGFVDVVALAVDQLVANVSEHAVSDETPSIESLISFNIADDDPGSLAIAVVDSGAGVAKTLGPKLSTDLQQLPEDDLLKRLFAGELPGWGFGRGLGLAYLAALVRGRKGSLRLATGVNRVVVAETIACETVEAAVAGSVATVQLPIP